MKAWRALARLGFGLLLFLGLVEGGVRLAHPEPRVQVFRTDLPGFHVDDVGGVPLWFDPDDGGPVRGTCVGGPVVALAGDSIFYVVDPGHEDARVRDVLEARLGGPCVLDVSQSGYRPDQQLLAAQRLHAERPLDVLVLLVWKADQRLHRVGDLWVDTERVEVDAGGTPRLPWLDVWPAAHRWLFVHSEAWRVATLATARKVSSPRSATQAYVDAMDWCLGHGVELVLVEAVGMDRPFDEAAARRARNLAAVRGGDPPPDADWRPSVQLEAERRGLPYVVLADAFVGEDVQTVRIDTCCHVVQRGHGIMADALAPVVAEALAGR